MNLHDGPTGQAIRQERNHHINQGKRDRITLRRWRTRKFPRMKHCPNINAHRTALFKARLGIA